MSDAGAPALQVEQTIRIEAPRERVFALITEVPPASRWFPTTALEPRVGGRFAAGWESGHRVEGEVTEFDPPRVVAYTWEWREQPVGSPTEVRWELDEDGDATVVRLSHTGFREQGHRESHNGGWGHYAQRLKTIAEGGDPGADRPPGS
jgi:uncharacterized protein YndB with AHSA1/START domain